MGYTSAVLTADQVKRRKMSLEDGLRYHLQRNICPPRSPLWIPALIEALAYLNELDRKVDVTEIVQALGEEVPESDYDECGKIHASVGGLIDAFYLEGFALVL